MGIGERGSGKGERRKETRKCGKCGKNNQCPMPNATLRVSQLDTEGEAHLHWSYENLFIEAGA
ncbi:hypothetical protein B4U84_17740 [Westiellopsis prolifica IICB1]|nr:hypothetical protein B4U84_17740 [Westiellopsis prolifica IICB1]